MEWSVVGLADRLRTEADAYALLEELRWDGTPVCPHCGSERAYFLTPANGVSRKTRTGAASERRVWKCAACRKQFTVLVGTIFHGTKIPVRTWLFVIFEMCANKNGLAAREVERKYGLSAKAAWFMTHRIREAMKQEPLAGMLRGTIVADETWIGGSPKNWHVSKRREREQPRAIRPGGTPQVRTEKTIVLSLINKTTGEARSRVIPDVTGATLRKAMAAQVDMAGSVLHTDNAKAYLHFSADFIAHASVNHLAGEYVRREGSYVVTTNPAENFFSQLKRSLDGTHHHVSRRHLPRYLAEFDYRYTTRKLSDTARTKRLIERTGGRRLSYRPLIRR